MENLLLQLARTVALVACLSATLTAQSRPSARVPAGPDDVQRIDDVEVTDLWFVELTGPPVADGSRLASVRGEKAAFRRAAAQAGLRYTERYAFDTLWNGLSVRISPTDVARLSRIGGVKAVYPVAVIQPPEPDLQPTPSLYSALAMTGADVVHSLLGFTGWGVKVAVLDSGIDYDHPDLGGCFGPTCRVAAGYDFVGDAFTGANTPAPDDDPDDCNGHGTHVAGIIGANGTVTGVAPDVTFGAYRVFGCTGYTTADLMLAAMERVLADGMDVLNMSIASAFQWPEYPTATAADRLVNRGVVVVAAIGNNGANGLYSTGAPGVGEKVIGVAAFDNTGITSPSFVVGDRSIGYVAMSGAPPPPTSGTDEMVYIGLACNAALPLLADPNGRVALATRGVCSFREKALNAIAAGATAVVIHNNVPGVFFGTVGDPALSTPVVGIALEDGEFTLGQTEPIVLTWTDQLASAPLATAGLISSFSSYGLSPDLALKPDIGAPGGYIYSTYPVELGGFATMSGTSMASPHVAGAAALMLHAHPRTSSQVMRDLLQNSADPASWWGNPSLGFLDTVHRQGAGMVRIDHAIQATTTITPAKLSLGEGEAGPATETLTIENNAPTAVTYDLSYVNALSTGGVIDPTFFLSNASVAFSAASLTVLPGEPAVVDVTITPATTPAYGQYGGYLVFTPRDDGQIHRIPFAGFVGDYQGITVLTQPTWLAAWDGADYVPQPDGATYTMTGADIPYFLFHLDHQVRMVRFEVFDAVSRRNRHRALQVDYFPRNSSPTSYFVFGWDGTTAAGRKTYTLPNGQYIVRFSVLKALGDDSNPAHWETWTSPPVTIQR